MNKKVSLPQMVRTTENTKRPFLDFLGIFLFIYQFWQQRGNQGTQGGREGLTCDHRSTDRLELGTLSPVWWNLYFHATKLQI